MTLLTSLTATEMARRVHRKEVSAVELVRAHLDRATRLQPRLNAFVALHSDGALVAAREAESVVMRSDSLGPLHGVPVTIKSSVDVAGLPCETGSRLRAGNVPQQDAPLVRRLKGAGAIILGNTNVPEFLLAYETNNLLRGRSNNPWNLERTPGGSSGGESAAIAAGCSAAGIGSDGGGSIRVPAHFTGICGLKPTPGRIPATGHFPPCVGALSWLGVVGPMARSVGDLRLLFEVLAGPDPGDPNSAPVPVAHPDEKGLRELRIGFFEDDGIEPVTEETRAAIRTVAHLLEQQGFQVEPFRPDGLEQARQLWWVFFGQTVGLLVNQIVAGRHAELSPTLQDFLSRVEAEPPLTIERFLEVCVQRDLCRARLLEQMQKLPILLCPVAAGPAFRHGEGGWHEGRSPACYLDTMRYSQWFNLTGNPAAVVPVSFSSEGLPVGVQIVGRPHEEELVLAVAEKVEQAAGGWRPPRVD